VLKLKLIFIAALTLSLTACPDRFNDDTGRDKETAKYSGTWVRAADYCDYMGYNTNGPTDYRCDDVQVEYGTTVPAVDEAWLMIAINRDGRIYSNSTYSPRDANGNWDLGSITPEGYYVGYLTAMGNKRGQQELDKIQILIDGDSLTLFTNSGRYTSRVNFLKVEPDQASAFKEAYNDCGTGGYCKGKTSTNNRQARRERRGHNYDHSVEFNMDDYNKCIAKGNSPENCG
jgi:hypothetical protein